MSLENKYINEHFYDDEEESEESNISVKGSAIFFNIICWIMFIVAIVKIFFLIKNKTNDSDSNKIVHTVMLLILSFIGGIIAAVLGGAKGADNVVQLTATAGTLTGSSIILFIIIFFYKNCKFIFGKDDIPRLKGMFKKKNSPDIPQSKTNYTNSTHPPQYSSP